MNVLVLCGGAGSRATHLPPGTPKFLTPVGDATVGDLLLGYLGRQGAASVVLACAVGREAILAHTKGQVIITDWLGYEHIRGEKKRAYPFHLALDLRHEARGTVQAIRWALGARLAPGASLAPPLVVVNGDTLLNISLGALFRKFSHRSGVTVVYDTQGTPSGVRILDATAVAELVASGAVNIEDHEWVCQVHPCYLPPRYFLDVGTPAGAAAAEGWVREHLTEDVS